MCPMGPRGCLKSCRREREQRLATDAIFVYCDTTDAGPDQVSRRKQVACALADVPSVFYLDVNCVLHQYHLMVREILDLMDEFLKELKESHPEFTRGFEGYCSSVAKLCNFHRSHVHDFIVAWET